MLATIKMQGSQLLNLLIILIEEKYESVDN